VLERKHSLSRDMQSLAQEAPDVTTATLSKYMKIFEGTNTGISRSNNSFSRPYNATESLLKFL